MNPVISNPESVSYRLDALVVPSEESDAPDDLAPTALVRRLPKDPTTVQVKRLGKGIPPKLYIVSGGYYAEMNLSDEERTKLQGHIDDLLKDPDIQEKLDGNEFDSINLNKLCIEFIQDERKKTIPFSYDLKPVKDMKDLYIRNADPEKKFTHSWPQSAPGMRTIIDKENGKQHAYVRNQEIHEKVNFQAEDEAFALDHKLNGPGPLSNPQILKALKRRHMASALKDQWLAYLGQTLQTIDKEKQPQRYQALLETGRKLTRMWDFAIQFEMAHPIFLGAGTSHVELIQKKKETALALLKKQYPKIDDKTANELANDLARAHLGAGEYRSLSKELQSPMKIDSLEDAFCALAKKAADGKPDEELEQAFQSWALQDLLGHLEEQDQIVMKNIVGTIRDDFQKIDFAANPLKGSTEQQIADFNLRMQRHALLAKQNI